MVEKHGESMKSFLDAGFDFSTDELSSEESQAFLDWNGRVHGTNDLNLASFAQFMVEYDPGGLKRLRRHMMTIDQPPDRESLPLGAGVLMWAYSYCVMGNKEGTLYEVIAARQLGASKAEVVDVFRLAGYAGGPFALNAAAALTSDYLRKWPEDDGNGLPWPDGWRPDPEAFKSGIDHVTDELTSQEVDALRAWYSRIYGETPGYLELELRLHPTAFKTMRIRFERVLGRALPARMAPLLMLHTATLRGWPVPARRAAQLAVALGALPEHVVSTVHWAAVYGGEAALEPILTTLSDVVDR